MTGEVVRIPCRCVYNRALVDDEGRCEGCGGYRDESWHAAVLAGRIGRLSQRDDETTSTSGPAEEEGTLWNYEEDED